MIVRHVQGEGIVFCLAPTCRPAESSLLGPDRVPGKTAKAVGVRSTAGKEGLLFVLLSFSFLCFLVQQLGHLEINGLCLRLLADGAVDLLKD